MSDDDGVEIVADGAKIMASETVSTGEYESAKVSTTLEVSIEDVNVGNGIPKKVRHQLFALKRSLQNQVRAAAEERLNDG